MESLIALTGTMLLLVAAWGFWVPAVKAMNKAGLRDLESARRQIFFHRLETVMGHLRIPPWIGPGDPQVSRIALPSGDLVFPGSMHRDDLVVRVWKDADGLGFSEGDGSWNLPGFRGTFSLEGDDDGLPLALQFEDGPETLNLVLGGRGR